MKRTNYSSGAPLEEQAGYSRMVKIGKHIYIGGTTSVQPDGTVFGETPKLNRPTQLVEIELEAMTGCEQ